MELNKIINPAGITPKIPTNLPESWFVERIGKYIMANSHAYNGMMKIDDKSHALYLCHTSQKYFFYRFSELDKQPFEL